MDANGLRFWQLADAGVWPDRQHAHIGGPPLAGSAERGTAALPAPTGSRPCRVLRLASERTLVDALAAADAFTVAQAALEEVPRAIDAVGSSTPRPPTSALPTKGYCSQRCRARSA